MIHSQTLAPAVDRNRSRLSIAAVKNDAANIAKQIAWRKQRAHAIAATQHPTECQENPTGLTVPQEGDRLGRVQLAPPAAATA